MQTRMVLISVAAVILLAVPLVAQEPVLFNPADSVVARMDLPATSAAAAFLEQVETAIALRFRGSVLEAQPAGRVTVIADVTPSGALWSVRVADSSGMDRLDDAAMKAVVLAAPLPRIPGTLSGAGLSIALTFEHVQWNRDWGPEFR